MAYVLSPLVRLDLSWVPEWIFVSAPSMYVYSHIIGIVLPTFQHNKFKQPKLKSNPSIIDQIIHRPLAIIDPYTLALRRNYYFPIAPEESIMSDEESMELQTEAGSQKQSPRS